MKKRKKAVIYSKKEEKTNTIRDGAKEKRGKITKNKRN